jgi:DNA-binding NarL/FixJ family response regulator
MQTGDAGRIIRILAIDDHPVLRDGLVSIIDLQADMKVVGEVGSGAEALDAFRLHRPDVTLMDLQMPGVGGVEAIQAIRAEFPLARIIVLTTYASDAKAVRALKAGAVGYLLKSSVRKELLETISAVDAGQRRIPPDIATEIAVHAGEEMLSEREMGVLRLVSDGHANKQIAWRLAISEDTVKAHMKNIFAKLDVADRTHAVTVALRRGIIEL